MATITPGGVVPGVSEGTASMRASWVPDPQEFGTVDVLVTLTQIPDASPVVPARIVPKR